MGTERKTEAGSALDELLKKRGLTQTQTAQAVGNSQAYVNQIVTGARRASPEWLELIAKVLDLSDDEKRRLHRAAARDYGFRIDADNLDLTGP